MNYKFVCIAKASLGFVSEKRYIYQNINTCEYIASFVEPVTLFHNASYIGVDIGDYIKLNNVLEPFLMNNTLFQIEKT